MNSWLAHYGILGQKWGVRRFQNADGTLTKAGKKRYNAAKALENRAEYSRDMADYYITENQEHKKRYSGEGAEDRWLEDMYGSNWVKDGEAAYSAGSKDINKIKQYAREEIVKERKDAQEEADRMSALYIKEAKEYERKISKLMSATSLDDFSKSELKEMEKLSKEYLKDLKRWKP